MEILLICGVIVAALIILLKTDIGKDPSKKTDSQLIREHQMQIKNVDAAGKVGGDTYFNAIQGMSRLTDEMKARGLLGSGTAPSRDPSVEPYFDQISAANLRQSARTSYEEGWKLAENKWANDQHMKHQVALTAVLLRRLQAEPGGPEVSEELMDMLSFEAIPFNNLQPEQGKSAICEYIVWRENPNLANIEIIQNAVDVLKEPGGFVDQVLKGKKESLPKWVPWAPLL